MIYDGANWRLPPHETIQGNGASTFIWAVISTILFLALKERNYGGRFRAPITEILISMAGFAFINDAGLL